MRRWALPCLALLIAIFSIAMDALPQQPDSWMCRKGGCRFDQTDAAILREGATPSIAEALLLEDPADPLMWCGYGEFLTTSGQSDKAAPAFARALALGGGMSPVLMRVANFDFTHDRQDEGLRLTKRILDQTDAFDQLLFSYLSTSGLPVRTLLGSAIPADPRAARSWLAWQLGSGSNEDILATFAWMQQNDLDDQASAVKSATTLWQHQAYRDAQQLWAEWLGPRRGDYLNPQRLTNRRLADAPSGVPFGWSLTPRAGVESTRRDGLDVRFTGEENVGTVGVHQMATVEKGRYRFSAEVSTVGLTTDQGVVFQITDAEDPRRLTVETPPTSGDIDRSWISVEFNVPESTRVVNVEVIRHPSLKFDSLIRGVLHIFQVSLVPVSAPGRGHVT